MGAAMEPRIVEQQEFSVIGIQVRTSNAKEMTGGGTIPKQWARFFAEGVAARIPNKVDTRIYAVYTGYASDRDGEYDFIIGMKVSSVSDVPPGMVAKTVPKGKYAIVCERKGTSDASCPEGMAEGLRLRRQQTAGRGACV
jgi:predicted transcriptional regulator YdeE